MFRAESVFWNKGMAGKNQAKLIYRFGHFEATPDSGELHRRGQRVRIQELPFRVLLALLEQPGQIVSREALAKELWADNTFVEFDQGLSTAMTKLRQALGDVAVNPRFVETVPKRGYRFIAPVTVAESPAVEAAQPAELPIATVIPDSAPAELKPMVPLNPAFGTRRSFTHWRWIPAVVFLIFLAGSVAVLRWYFGARPALHAYTRVVLADFENRTGKGAFDDTLQSAVRLKLEESPFFLLVPAKAVAAAMVKTGKTAPEVSASDAQSICKVLHAGAVIEGSIRPADGGLRLRLQATSCGGERLAAEEAFSPSIDELLSVLGETTDRLRQNLGEPEKSVQRFSTPILKATTTSFSALEAFAAGEKKRVRGQDHETIADYKLATDLDPEFALAYARLGTIYANENEVELSRAIYQKAFDLRVHTTERERLYLAAHYYGSALGDVERALEVYTLWRQQYPQDLIAPNNLADLYETVGQPEQARRMAREALRIDPDNAFPYAGLLQADQRLGLWREARDVWRSAVARGLDNSVISRMAMFRIGVATGDEALMEEQLNWAVSNPREGELLMLEGWMKAAAGKLRESRTLFHRVQAIALSNGLKEFAADAGEDLAQFEADFGETKEARIEVERSLQVAPKEANVKAFAAMILAGTGDEKQARALVSAVRSSAPQNTIFSKIILPITEARLLLGHQQAEAAVEQLRPASPYDLSRVTELAAIYYRAQALLAAHRGIEAGKEYERLRQFRAVCPITPYLALAELGVARSKRSMGDRDGACAAYSAFLKDWKEADPDLPILLQARAEYRAEASSHFAGR